MPARTQKKLSKKKTSRISRGASARSAAAPRRPGKKRLSPTAIYYFGKTRTDGDGSMKSLLGGKGANLAEMTRLGLPVPPGFTITTAVCRHHTEHGAYPDGLAAEVADAVTAIVTRPAPLRLRRGLDQPTEVVRQASDPA